MNIVLLIVVVVLFIIIIASLYIGLFQLPTIVLESIANTSKVRLTFTYDSISFVKSELGPNLISEAIGIATTVLIIDRIIKWREIRRWHPARVFLLDEISIS